AFVEGTGGIVQATHLGGVGPGPRFYRVRRLSDRELEIPITSLRLSGTQVFIRFNTTAGLNYRLEYTQTLDGSPWRTALDNIAGTGGPIQVTETIDSGASGFYRIRLVP